MIKEDLVQYITRQLSQGHNVTSIREHLLKHNYKPEIADEALHKAAEIFGASVPKKKPYKKIAYAFIALLAIGGLILTLFFMQTSEDLSGAASEVEQPTPELVPEEPKEQVPEEIIEEPIEEEIIPEELTEESVKDESTPEDSIEESVPEESTPIQTPAGCTSNSNCDAGFVCYQQICQIDNDRDLVSDTQENEKGMNPLDQDSDDDGYFDYVEVDEGTDALDSASPGYTTCSTTATCGTGQACSENKICITCSDPDNTKYKTKGVSYGVHYVTNKALFTQDTCSNTANLMEFYCTADGYLYYKTINCEQEEGIGYYCSNGKCVTG